MIFNMICGAPEEEVLNFEVVAYATEAAMSKDSPLENTIGIVTNVPITKWAFSAKDPFSKSNIENGAVWITTYDKSTVEFNALKENMIQVCPISVKQYVSGAYVDVYSKIYQAGKWADWRRHIFNNGDQCVDLTGGWAKSGMNMDGYHPNNGAISIGSVISLSSNDIDATYGTVAAVSTVDPIDLTNVRRIFFKGKLKNTDTNKANAVAGYISTSKDGTWIDGTVIASVYIKSTTTDTVELPVDTYNGKYYINIASFRSSAGEISEVWMT